MKRFLKRFFAFVSVTIICMFMLCSCTIWSVKEDIQNNAQEQAEEIGDNVMGFLDKITPDTSKEQTDDEWYEVVRVVDGDTFVVSQNGKETKVRLIGVDTPESVATGKKAEKNCEEGKEASNFTKSLIEGKKVRLETDVDAYDDYDRMLAYAYLEDGQMLNKILLEKGYARLMTIQPNVKYVDEFKEIQKRAQENKAGFWDGFDQWQ